MKYEIISNDFGGFVIKATNSDKQEKWIPVDEANADYQQYLIDTDGGLPIPEGSVE